MLDEDLAGLYGVETRALVQAVKRNKERFPADFMFQLSHQEAMRLRSQTVISKKGRGGRRHAPYAFSRSTASPCCRRFCAAIAPYPSASRLFGRSCAFVGYSLRMRTSLGSSMPSRRGTGARFRVIFDAIRDLMNPASRPHRPIGFAQP
jgi:hypothetical protein